MVWYLKVLLLSGIPVWDTCSKSNSSRRMLSKISIDPLKTLYKYPFLGAIWNLDIDITATEISNLPKVIAHYKAPITD